MHADAPCYIWAESVGAAVYIRYRMPMTIIGVIPYKRIFGRKPIADQEADAKGSEIATG